MANTPISQLTALGAAPTGTDKIPLVDISDLSQSINGTTKFMTVTELGLALGGGDGNGIYDGNGSLSGITTVTMATNNFIWASTGDANLLKLDAVNNRIGIGTGTPTQKLDIIGNGRFSGDLGVGINAISVSTIAHFKSDLSIRFEGAGVGFGHQEFVQFQAGGGNNDYFRRLTSGGAALDFFKFATYARLVRDGGTIRFGINTGATLPAATQHIIGNETNIDALRVDGNSTTNDLVVDFTGNVGVGIAAPIGRLHIDQSSLTGAIPTLYLDQSDLSEEMIEFNTTIGVGNPVEAIGAKTLTTTHFIKITLPGGLTRYIPAGTIA